MGSQVKLIFSMKPGVVPSYGIIVVLTSGALAAAFYASKLGEFKFDFNQTDRDVALVTSKYYV